MHGAVTGILASRNRKGILETVDLGPYRVVLCAPYVTLTAEIFGSLLGHSILWEQVSGTSVDWGMSDLTSAEVVYTEPSTIKDDKKFRLWVDKGTSDEYYKTLWIYGTPTEFLDGLSSVNTAATLALPNEIDVNCWFVAAPTSTTPSKFIPPTKTGYVYWDLPTNIKNITGTAIEINNTGQYVQSKYVSVSTNNRFISANIGTTTFRIRVFFLASDGATRSVLSKSFSLDTNNPANTQLVITETLPMFSIMAPTLNKTTSLKVIDFYEVSDDINFGVVGTGPKYTSKTTLFTLKNQDVEDNIAFAVVTTGPKFSRTTTMGTITIIGSS